MTDEERIAELEKELEGICYAVSHDLRAPLRAVAGFSQAVFEDYAEALDDEGKHYLERMRAAAGQMGEMIDALLELSRLGRRSLRPERVDLSALAREIARELEDRESGRPIAWDIQEGIVVRVDGDQARILLEHLLGNACKFTAPRDTARIEIRGKQEGDRWSCFVRDNGVGFEPAQSGRLFTPFQRLHASSEFPGVGIGLALARRIVLRHGGRISAEGAVDAGATISFSLSAAEETR